MNGETTEKVTKVDVESTVNKLLIESVNTYMTAEEIRLLDAKLAVIKKHLDQMQ